MSVRWHLGIFPKNVILISDSQLTGYLITYATFNFSSYGAKYVRTLTSSSFSLLLFYSFFTSPYLTSILEVE